MSSGSTETGLPRHRPAVPAPPTAVLGWTIVLPLKRVSLAKSRLTDATPDASAHAELVRAIRSDTLRVAAGAGRLLIVHAAPDAPEDGLPYGLPADAEVPAGLTQIVQQRPGLNQALREGAAHAARHWPDDGIAALVGDLPALRASELTDALSLAADHPRAFVPDSAGTGTTMLTARPGVELAPQFGPDSARRHRSGAVALPAGAGLRLDVDTAQDLAAALELGVGAHTTAVLRRRS